MPPDLPVKKTPPPNHTHYAQSGTGVSLMKSPVIKISRVPRRQLLGGVVNKTVGSEVTRRSPRQSKGRGNKGRGKTDGEEGRKSVSPIHSY